MSTVHHHPLHSHSTVSAGIKRPRSQLSEASNPLNTMRPIIGYLRDDAVELINDEDMNEAYYHGYYGKGTVSRRNPNQAMIIPQDLLQNWIQNITTIQNERQSIGSDTRRYDSRGGIGALSSSAAATTAAATTTTLLSSSSSFSSSSSVGSVVVSIDNNSSSSSSSSSLPSSISKPFVKYADLLTVYANEFEHTIMNEPLPDAYYCASMIASHSHDEFHFQHARSIAHYVACPPPRLRHVQPMPQPNTMTNTVAPATMIPKDNTIDKTTEENILSTTYPSSSTTQSSSSSSNYTSPSSSSSSTAAATTTTTNNNNNTKIRFEHMVFETSILEPEAVIYLLACAPDRVIILPSALRDDDHFLSSSLPNKYDTAKLSLRDLWLYFCARIRNFPARFSVYYYCRQLGYIVRDGHSFGTDFVLYTFGPGNGHAIAAIIVMPLLITGTGTSMIDNTTTTTTNVNDVPVGINTSKTHSNGQESSAPPVLAPLKEQDVLSNWEQLHAHARVVGTIRKSFILAYPSLPLPFSVTNGSGRGSLPPILDTENNNYYSGYIAHYLSNPQCVLRMSTIPSSSNDILPSVSEPSLASTEPLVASSSSFPTPTSDTTDVPTISMHLQMISRWLTSKEHKFKSEILLSQVAAMEIFNENNKPWEDSPSQSSSTGNTDDGSKAGIGTTNKTNNNGTVSGPVNSGTNSTTNKPLTKQQCQQQVRQTLTEFTNYQKQQQQQKYSSSSSVGTIVPTRSKSNGGKMSVNNWVTVFPTVTSMVLSLHDTDNDNECIHFAQQLIKQHSNDPLLTDVPTSTTVSSSTVTTILISADPQPLEETAMVIKPYTKYGGPYHQSLVQQAYQQLYLGSNRLSSFTTEEETLTETVRSNTWYMDRTLWGKISTYGRRN